MLREYELFYIVRPDLEEEQVRAAMDEITNLVAGQGGEVTKSSLWGRRRLAYTIAGFTDGYYVLKEMAFPGEKLRDLERQLKLDERVIRQLITLRQVYLLPEGEDRRGRIRNKSRGRVEDAPEEAVAPAEALSTDDAGSEAEEAAEAVTEEAVAPDGAFSTDDVGSEAEVAAEAVTVAAESGEED
ncbi:MAG: 30S ribosomal protein S6 [Candidatus Dormibacteria bacterium]